MLEELASFISTSPLCDTHEHLRSEANYLESQPDILQQLFQNYVSADLVSAGASIDSVNSLIEASDREIEERFRGIEKAWTDVQHTGYGQAVRIAARELYDMEEITAESLAQAQEKNRALLEPGQRRQILSERTNLDHVQIDDFTMNISPDPAGADFFLYDISWVSFSSGLPNLKEIHEHTGIEVRDLASLDHAMEAIFSRYAARAVAVKSQHAYSRTLRWQRRSEEEAKAALDAFLREGEDLGIADRLCLGDWCLARGVELAGQTDLPFKIHTGYYAGHSRMPVDYIRSGHLCPLLATYPQTRFVLMHIAYPYSEELIALTKHYPNVYADLCWAWSINPRSAASFVRSYLHAAPINKLFAFGGDTSWPGAVLAYAKQARHWLLKALEAEVEDGSLREEEAIRIAGRLMMQNQYECFHITTKRQAAAEPISP